MFFSNSSFLLFILLMISNYLPTGVPMQANAARFRPPAMYFVTQSGMRRFQGNYAIGRKGGGDEHKMGTNDEICVPGEFFPTTVFEVINNLTAPNRIWVTWHPPLRRVGSISTHHQKVG
jgi:hypothetical protein